MKCCMTLTTKRNSRAVLSTSRHRNDMVVVDIGKNPGTYMTSVKPISVSCHGFLALFTCLACCALYLLIKESISAFTLLEGSA